MTGRKQEHIRKSAPTGVFYVYNNKFNKSPENLDLEGKMAQNPNRHRILSNKDVNCCDINAIRPTHGITKKVKLADPINIEEQENIFQIDHNVPETAEFACKKKMKRKIATNGSPLNKKHTDEIHRKKIKPSNIVKFEDKQEELSAAESKLATIIHNEQFHPLHKKHLKCKNRYTECDIKTVSDLILYSESYIEDIVINMLNEEQNTKSGYDSITSQKEFQHFIELLLPLQDRYGLWLQEVYTAIHIFLKSIQMVKSTFDVNTIISASILLAHKVSGASNKAPSLKAILRFCHVDSRREAEVLRAERKILQNLAYHIFQPDPLVFVLYYILKLQLDSDKLIWSCSNYIMNCAILKINIHAFMPSKIAAAAVLLSLAYMKTECQWDVLQSFPAFYPENTLYPVCCILQDCIGLVHMHYGQFLTFEQYNSEKYDFIAEKIVKEMIL